MKIAFICGSLEPGYDGVGDYARRLAAELKRQGHQVVAIALNDRYCDNLIEDVQYADGIFVPVLRLPSAINSKSLHFIAIDWLDKFCPDFISLQYVPFSFQKKGLPLGLGSSLAKIGKGKPWHIMFHELWVGMDEHAPIKFRLWGKIQKLIIKNLLAHIKPSVVHTQTKLYQFHLKKIGANAQYLPLFSNIPIIINSGGDFKKNFHSGNSKSKISFILFGGIHPGAPISDFTMEAASFAISNQVQIELVIAGRCGAEQINWVNAWNASGLVVKVLGEQSAEQISEVIAKSTFGISTTPLALIEKSGSVAAMLEHGLTVISVSRYWKPKGFIECEVPDGVIEYQVGNFVSCIDIKGINSKNKISEVSRHFVDNLLEASI